MDFQKEMQTLEVPFSIIWERQLGIYLAEYIIAQCPALGRGVMHTPMGINLSQWRHLEMEEKKTLLTYAGLKKLEDELENLKVVKRKEVAGKIKEAREQGDLSENAEYDAAKDEQRDIEARIEELEKILKNAEVVVEDEVDLDKINVGCTVDVYDNEFEEEIEFKIVGSTEANSLQGKISNESPVGKALIGKKVGDIVKVETQAGEMEYKVLKIDRSK